MLNWETKNLGDCVTHQKGFAFKSSDFINEGCLIVRVSNFTSDSIDLNGCSYLSLENAKNFQAVKLLKDDVVIATVGSWENNPASIVGKVIRVPQIAEGALLNQNAVRLRTNQLLTQEYLYYLLKNKQFSKYIVKTAQGSANQASITLRDIFNFEFEKPPIEEQKAIAKILSSLDNKIELNRQMNTNLEAMARALFKAWFVDFEPVRANSENRTSESASPEIAKLFPSEFENDIPKGWKLSTIGEEVNAVGGGTPSTKEPSFWNGEYNWVTPKDLSNLTDKVLISSERTITAEGLAKISSGELPKETVLLSSRAPVGYLAIAKIPVAINQGFIAMKCNKLLPSSYVLQWTEQSMDKIKNRASGTTFAEINKANFRPLPVIVPSKIVIEKYDGIGKLLYDQIATNAKENATLSQIRDELLPKLIQGKIRVSNL
jgi:type I restriction enzyme S subunit